MAKKKKGGKRSKGRSSGGMGKSIDGLIAGAGGVLLAKFIPLGAWNQPVVDIITGHYRGNETLQTIGGRSIGAMMASGINLPTTTGSTNGFSLVG